MRKHILIYHKTTQMSCPFNTATVIHLAPCLSLRTVNLRTRLLSRAQVVLLLSPQTICTFATNATHREFSKRNTNSQHTKDGTTLALYVISLNATKGFSIGKTLQDIRRLFIPSTTSSPNDFLARTQAVNGAQMENKRASAASTPSVDTFEPFIKIKSIVSFWWLLTMIEIIQDWIRGLKDSHGAHYHCDSSGCITLAHIDAKKSLVGHVSCFLCPYCFTCLSIVRCEVPRRVGRGAPSPGLSCDRALARSLSFSLERMLHQRGV